jgi:competence protein ComEC
MPKTSFIFFSFLLIFFLGSKIFGQNVVYKIKSTAKPCLNVRSEPSTDATSIECLNPGTLVTVINSVPFWREIKFENNQTGWVAKKYIEPLAGEDVSETVDSGILDNAFLTIHFVDVGQGDAIWIQTFDDGIDGNGIYEGYTIIIDGGPYSADKSNPLLPYLEKQGHHGANIEALLISHPHDDHFSGAETISRHFSINHYYDPGYPSKISSYVSFKNAMKGTSTKPGKAKHIHIGKQNFGTINWGKELNVEVLYAWKGDTQNKLGFGNTEINNSSIVLRIQYGEHVFLFMGDAEGKERDDDAENPKYVEKILLETVPDKLKSTVLKIAHHGSETSSTIPFINAVDPDIVIVQSGRKPFKGTFIPDKTTLQRYCQQNPDVKIYRTDEGDEAAGFKAPQAVDGDHIIIRSNGSGKPQVKSAQGGQPINGKFCQE